jgi:iron complex outermembrane receptor protein
MVSSSQARSFGSAMLAACALWRVGAGEARAQGAAPGSASASASASPASGPEVAPSQASEPAADKEASASPVEVHIHGRQQAPSRGASDFQLRIGALADVPRKNAAELLTLAPGILLTNEGGDGHAAQIFLRGFDARLGQDVELTVGGVPVNESGHVKGNGYADLGFVIPEVVERLRVLEGPFDPRQGNYAVAGSADYQLGLAKRGVTARYQVGSFDTHRLVATWGPANTSPHTFGAVELFTTGGFGQNRDGQRASAIGQYEGAVGTRGSFRVLATANVTRFHSAGVLRDDDVRAGRVGFYDTYDSRQSAEGMRFSLSGDVEGKLGDLSLSQQVFAVYRSSRIRENFTGFLLDPQEPVQKPHGQRGDLIDASTQGATFGARGWARYAGTLGGLRQELEVGYFARADVVRGTQLRSETATDFPYRRETDLDSVLGDVGAWVDGSARFTSWLALRGGVRADVFSFDVLDRCAVQSIRQPTSTNPPGDESCLSQQNFGAYREPDQRASAASAAILPRATMVVGPFQGFTFSAAVGQGVRSIDPSYVTQDRKTPFAQLTSGELGVGYAGGVGDVALVARSIVFHTWVEQDLVFSETAGRAVFGGATLRTGWAGIVRATGPFFDVAANATLVKARFEKEGLLIPYVPEAVLRFDGSVFHELPIPHVGGHAFRAAGAAGLTYIAPRPLPFGQRSDDIATLDLSATFAWGPLELGGIVTNLFDFGYRLGEYNFASDFGSQAQPTLVPMRHFAAGQPRALYVTLSGNLGGTP